MSSRDSRRLNLHFVDNDFPWIVEPITNALPAVRDLLYALGVAAPFIQIGFGVGLLTRKYRRISLILAISMHVFILAMFGPFGHDWNNIIWPQKKCASVRNLQRTSPYWSVSSGCSGAGRRRPSDAGTCDVIFPYQGGTDMNRRIAAVLASLCFILAAAPSHAQTGDVIVEKKTFELPTYTTVAGDTIKAVKIGWKPSARSMPTSRTPYW